jgi:exopolyphosphatase/guanosine-5'-triphosphate,3'-diphosphate pyrophosphatase
MAGDTTRRRRQTGPVPGPVAPSEVLAAVDIGTNSVHGVVARITATEGGPRIEVLDREKEVVRLGESAGDMRELSGEAIDRAVAALDRFRQVAAVHEAPITAVATSAVREAENRDTFIARAWAEAGVSVEVISGVEEARLIHLGVLQSVPVFERRLLLCDIGGGSTELLVGQRGETLAARSLKLGAIRLTRRFFDGDRVEPGAVDACRRFVRGTLAPFAKEVRHLDVEVAVGSSGTIESVAEMATTAATGTRPRSVRNLRLGRGDVGQVVTALVEAPTNAARAELPGLDPTRADIMLAGAVLLEQVFEALGVEEMLISDHALREGVLLDAWRRRHGGSLHHLSVLRRRSVVDLAALMDDEPDHSAQVARLALRLFDATAGRHGLGDEAREVLEAAALLCNVGLFLSHAQHHKHSYYVIRTTDRLAGFTDHEVERIALVARYHRKSEPKAKHPEFASLDAGDQQLVRCLAGLLRVAIGLDRSHALAVDDVEVVDAGTELVVEILPAVGADVGLELYAATTRTDLLEEALGVPVRVRQGDAGPGRG